ncbi:hypothetical protein LSCM1_01598 [Leishmania martiniquensis]|uniref:Large ribosomal subunit protein bL12 C-terminal domain-containing protein n=1 Tax=Leishmania martiniquensis TaxID=1580590 RepID=A0A836H6W1_9TRYP|nr:hypothetical protein LSCM1_01598 [Leishmania martiniquensis]
MKERRAVCGLSIQEAKTAIDKVPGVIARQTPKADAEKLKDAMVCLWGLRWRCSDRESGVADSVPEACVA